MKNVKLILVAVVAMLFLGVGNVSAQEKEAQTVIIQSYPEAHGTKLTSLLLVIDPNGNSYEIPMNEMTVKNKKAVWIDNLKILQKEINKWKNEGFIIDGKSETNSYVNIIMSKY